MIQTFQKRHTYLFLGLFLFASLFVSSYSHATAYGDAEATLNWSTLGFSTTGYLSYNYSSTDYSNLYSSAVVNANGAPSSLSVNGTRTGSLSLTCWGTITATMNYTWAQHLSATKAGDVSNLSTLIGLYFVDGAGNRYGSQVLKVNNLTSPGSSDYSGEGTLVASFTSPFTQIPSILRIETYVVSDAGGYSEPEPPTAVPEPATMWLLGSGLIGLVGFGRKQFLKK